MRMQRANASDPLREGRALSGSRSAEDDEALLEWCFDRSPLLGVGFECDQLPKRRLSGAGFEVHATA